MIDEPEEHVPLEAVSRRSRRRRWMVALAAALLALVIGAELVARFALGLGDPPLLMRDPDMEYRYQPSRTYKRFGNMIAINRWSMRSADFPEHKSDGSELRILLLGDSVVFGGSQTTQADLASEIILRELPGRINDRSVVVGNASAGSWGPQNLLAYVKKYGLFDADIVVVVLSSHDWADVMTFDPLGPEMPTRSPVLAIEEAVMRYVPRMLSSKASNDETSLPEPDGQSPDVQQSLAALAELLSIARDSGAIAGVAQHLEASETMDSLLPGHAEIAAVARAAGADVIQLGPSFEQARRAGEHPYRDNIHPNEIGQRVIAQTLMPWIIAQVRDRQ